MSFSRAPSFSVKISMPVAWGAKTWIKPFLIPELAASSWILSDKSMKSTSPCVENFMVLLVTLKFDTLHPLLMYSCGL